LILGLLTLGNISSVWPIFAAMILLGTARAFIMPAAQAILPNMVPREHLGRAVAFNSSVFQTTTIVGPAIGGVLLIAGGLTVFIVILTCMVIATLSAMAVRTRAMPERKETEDKPELDLKSLLSGLSFVRSRPAILGAISLDLFAVLFGGSVALMPIYAKDILHVGPTGLGFLRSAPGVGAVICALWLTAKPIDKHVGAWMFISVGLFGLSTMVFGSSTHFALSLFALVILGASDMVSVFVRGYLVQIMTPDYIRGRVSAISSVFIGASNELGEFESGVTAEWLGTIRSVVIGGAATIAVTLIWRRLFPSLRNMNEFPQMEK
jgi:MFS family permease